MDLLKRYGSLGSRVLRLPKNTRGQVLIMGDVHGAYDLVWAGMKAANFNPDTDWLLGCGDLIDRGAGSARARKFLQQHYVGATAGNHDRYLVDAWKQGALDDREVVDALARMNYNGMCWMKDVSLDELKAMAAAFDELPYVIEMETDRGLVGMVHGDVPAGMDWQTFTAKIEAGDEYATRMALGMDQNEFHESRQRVEQRRKDGVPGIGRLFVGHTPQFDGLLQLGNVWAIDSGAVFGEAGKGRGHLTMVDPRMDTVYLGAPLASDRPNPLLDMRIAGEIPDRAFSSLDCDQGEEAEAPRM